GAQKPMHCVQALGCRVTGGGTVDACGPGDSGCDPNTPGSCAPDSCASPALEATHGGQVGAPIGVPTPFTPDSACIAGEWTHVRHIRKGLFGNFHARNFDSLECACLPCPENPDVQGVVGALCNPGDRICGPEPRRAPANKICFSGAGNYAPTNGPRAGRSVVFRVDVEDRSEPGGTNGPPPPDRYRIRIWFVPADTSDGQDLRPDGRLTRGAGGAETAARSAAGAQSLQDRGRLEPNLGEAAIPQHLRRDVLRPLAGCAAQQGGQERTVRGLQLADHGGAQLGVSVERPDSRPQRLGAHRRIFVMQAEIDELPKRCGWRPDGVGQNTRNRYRGMAVDERRQR